MVPPDGGSRILFFSGGTALAPVAAELSRHTRNAVHVITTFDSGGSSAELRRSATACPRMPGRKPSTVSWRLSHPERIRWWPRFPSP